MNVRQLIDLLEDFDPEAEVRLASQPNYPLQSLLGGVASRSDLSGAEECEEHGYYNCDECSEASPVIWLVEGSEPSDSPYASKALWEVARDA